MTPDITQTESEPHSNASSPLSDLPGSDAVNVPDFDGAPAGPSRRVLRKRIPATAPVVPPPAKRLKVASSATLKDKPKRKRGGK